MYKCKQDLNPLIVLLTEQKLNIRSEIKILFKNLYGKQLLVSIAFHTVDLIFGTN